MANKNAQGIFIMVKIKINNRCYAPFELGNH